MTDKDTIFLIIDNRERKLMKIFDEEYQNIHYEARQLDIADVVISKDVAIERKEGYDFIASIIDNRLFEQLIRLKDTYENPILIIEGLSIDVFENIGMRISSVYGALAKISFKMGIAVIPTPNLKHTAVAIERLAYREQIKNGEIVFSRKAPKNMSEEERRVYILEGLIDIGSKKAKSLIEEFKTPYKALRAIKQTEIIYTRTGNPKGIKGPLQRLSGFGWKFIEKNQQILFGEVKSPQKKIDEI
jgi:ERCC4-type nuclease